MGKQLTMLVESKSFSASESASEYASDRSDSVAVVGENGELRNMPYDFDRLREAPKHC